MNAVFQKRLWIGHALATMLMLASVPAQAKVEPAAILGSHMVVQRNQPISIWGKAAVDEPVTVTLGDQKQQTVADDRGTWSVTLGARPASVEPVSIVIQGSDSSVTLDDVLVGDVWLCSGQSNMAMRVEQAMNRDEEIAAADYPLIRHLAVPDGTAREPQKDIKAQADWEVCSPQTAGQFTAVGYYFAQRVHKELGIPIGLINSSRPGVPIRAWISRDVLDAIPSMQPSLKEYDDGLPGYEERYEQYLKRPVDKKAVRPMGWHHPNSPSGLYNCMIHPLAPLHLRGALWYQGEANAGRSELYSDQLSALIGSWRKLFHNPDMPLGIVQLPNYGPGPGSWARLRHAQLHTAMTIPNVGLVATIDVGHPQNVHPKNKQAVGTRLAGWALAEVYGKDIEWSGPLYRSMTVAGGAIRVHFDHVAGGLVIKGGDKVENFKIAGADGTFVDADAKIDGNTVIVSSPLVAQPVMVSYGWQWKSPYNLFNTADLPAVPFTTADPFTDLPQANEAAGADDGEQ